MRRIRAVIAAFRAAWSAAITDFDTEPWRDRVPAASGREHRCTDACDPDLYPYEPGRPRHRCTPGCNPGNCPHEDL